MKTTSHQTQQHPLLPSNQNKQVFYINGNNLNPENVGQAVQKGMDIALTPEAIKMVEKSRGVISKMMEDPNAIIYGVTTGFGNFASFVIDQKERNRLQKNLITSHSVGVGKPIGVNIVKRMMILRINTIAKGSSGISLETLNRVIAAYNKGFIPCVPEQGTVGASGDLAPLSHMILGMLGQGQACDSTNSTYRDAQQVMDELQLKTLELKQKEGITLINGTQFMTSILADCYPKAKNILDSAIVLHAFAAQIFGMDPNIYSEGNLTHYKKQNQEFYQVLKDIKQYFDKEKISELHQNRIEACKNLVCPESLLFGPENIYSTKKSLNYCSKLIKQQMNASTDNPLVLFAQDQEGITQDSLISAGNFHGQYVAKCGDFMAMSLFNLGKYSQARNQKYVNGRINGLNNDFLVTKDAGLNNGFMIAQYTSAALLSESKLHVNPSSVDSISTSSCQQDHVSMGGYAARKCNQMIENVAQILGVQLLLCLTALDLIPQKPKASQKLEKIRQIVRKDITLMDEDRYYGKDLEAAKRFIMNNLSQLK